MCKLTAALPPETTPSNFSRRRAFLLLVVTKGGYRKQEWQKIRERNGGLDTRVYARAAAIVFGIDRFGERQWVQLREQVGTKPAPKQPETPSQTPVPRQEKDQPWLSRRRWLRKSK